MSVDDILKISGILITLIVSVAGLIKYFLIKHDEDVRTRFATVHGRFKDHGEKITLNTNDIKKQSDRISETREELKSEYVRHGHMDKKMDELRESNIAIFDRLNTISSDLNQLVGAHNGKVKKDDE